MKRLIYLIALLPISLLLNACPGYTPPYTPDEVNFATDPLILRGIWLGIPEDASQQALSLDLQATFVDQERYSVIGTLKFGDGELLSLSGVVEGNETTRYLQTQARPPFWESFSGTLRSTDGKESWDVAMKNNAFPGQSRNDRVWRLELRLENGSIDWQGELRRP